MGEFLASGSTRQLGEPLVGHAWDHPETIGVSDAGLGIDLHEAGRNQQTGAFSRDSPSMREDRCIS